MNNSIPTECPKCQYPTIQIQVLAWAQFSSGSFDLLDSDPGWDHLSGENFAFCCNPECNHEWKFEV